MRRCFWGYLLLSLCGASWCASDVAINSVAATQTFSETTKEITQPDSSTDHPEAQRHEESEAERWERMYIEEKLRNTLSWKVVAGVFFALLIEGWCVIAFIRSVRERELASYRKGLFDEDPNIRFASAIGLAKYPHEAIWLVNRWPIENKLLERAETEYSENNTQKQNGHARGREIEIRIDKHRQVKQAIYDALGTMVQQFGWDLKRIERRWLNTEQYEEERCRILQYMSKIGLPVMDICGFVSVYYWLPRIARGPRLDRRKITGDIGSITLARSYLYRSDMSHAMLRGSGLWSSNLQKAALMNSNLEEANLNFSNLQEAILSDANLRGISLMSANLKEADLFNADMQKADIRFADMREACLGSANLQEADMGGANLQQAYLESANLQEAVLWMANLRMVNLDFANLQKAHLGEAYLQNASLEWTDLRGATLRGVNLKETNLKKTNLSGANLQDIQKWEKSTVRGANITGVVNAPPGFIEWAIANGAIDENRSEEVPAKDSQHQD